MRMVSLFALICLACGCTRSAKHILPPLYESQYEVVLGIEASGNAGTEEAASMFASIAMKSGFTVAVLEQPFDAGIVDLVVRITEVSITPRTYGFIPRRIELKGAISLKLIDRKGSLIKEYHAEGSTEQSSLNPFSGRGDAKLLVADMITSILDDIDEDFQEEAPVVVRNKLSDQAEIESTVQLCYPSLSDLKRNEIRAHMRIQAELPPRRITLHILDREGVGLISQQLYYDASSRRNDTRKWEFSAHAGPQSLPFAEMLHYELEITDIDGNSSVANKGLLTTVSSGMFRMKQAEVLAHGTLFSAFGGLVVVMLLYSM